MNRIVLHIDRLVLRGVAHEQRDAVVAGLLRSIEAELSAPGMARELAAAGPRAVVRARFATPAAPGALGQAAAVTLARSLKP